MLDLKLLGGCALERDGVPVGGTAAQRRRLALLALLARSGTRGLSRERLVAHLSPESGEEGARNLLKQAVFVLRRELGADLIQGSAELRLNFDLIRCDARDFEALLDEDRPAQAVGLYAGPFFDGFHLGRDAEAFERWTDAERAHLAGRYLSALETLVTQATDRGDAADAVGWWRRLVAAEPLSSRYTQGLMRGLAAVGDPGAAVRQARVYEALVQSDLGAAADPAVTALASRLGQTSREVAGLPEARTKARAAGDRAIGSEVTPTHIGATKPSAASAHAPVRRAVVVRWLLAGTAAIAALAFLGSIDRERALRRRLDPGLVAVAPFGVYDAGLELWREGMVDILSRELDGAGSLRSVSPTLILRQWQGSPDPESAARLGRETGAGLVLFGTLMRAGGDSVRATAALVNAATGDVLADLDRRDAAERMDRLTDSLAVGVLRELGERFPRGAVPGSGLSASSIEPLKYFLRGEQFFRRTRWDSARVYYEKTVARDTAFALAYRRLGAVVAWERVNWDSLASVYLLRAGALNHGLPPRDSLLIRADSLTAAANATDDPLTSWTIVRELFRTLGGATERYPEDPEAWFALGEAGYHFGTGPVVSVPAANVLKAFDRALALDSAFAPAYLHPIELALDGEGRDLGLRYARAYLALNPQDVAHRGVRLVERLLTFGTGSPEVRALLDSAPADVLVSARTRLRRWTDTAETAVMLSRLLRSGRQTDYALFTDSSLMRRRLAEQLAYRGHLQEAYAVLGDQRLGLFVDLAHLDAVPAVAARATFARWLAEGSDYARLVLPWWSARGDSVALAEFLQRARTRLRSALEPSEQAAAEYDTAAAQAHFAVLRGDTTEALSRFTTLPDSACIRCYFDRLIRARLLSAASRHPEAMVTLRERLVPYLTPIEIVFALERSRVAERLGDRREAAEASRLVARAWHQADPQLQILADEARARARRMGRDLP